MKGFQLFVLLGICLVSPCIADEISITSDRNTLYFGDVVSFTGNNSESENVYLFITGPNLPSWGGNLIDPHIPIVNGVESYFTQIDVKEDNSWEFSWATGNLDIDPGTYSVYAVSAPLDKNHLDDAGYAIESVVFYADTREYPDMPDYTATEEILPEDLTDSIITGENIKISADCRIAYFGDAITLSGINSVSDTVFLFVTGPNLPTQGGRLTDPTQPVDTGDPSSFTNPDVLDDNTFEYKWQTANLNIDAGTYTVFAVATPSDKNNLLEGQYATVPITIRKPYLSATLSRDKITQCDTLKIHGIATGSPSSGVQFWIMGKNYLRVGTESVNNDGSFEYEITEGMSCDMDNGDYFVIVQHPMYNDRLDFYPMYFTDGMYAVGSYPVVNSKLVKITGSGSLQSFPALNALLYNFNNPSIDDRYQRLKFVVGEPSPTLPTSDYLSSTVTTQNNEITIQGFARGNPPKGIAIWVIGDDTVIYDVVTVNPDSSFIHTVPTSSLPNGDYTVIVHHPMYNNDFDVYPDTDNAYVLGPYPVAGSKLFSLYELNHVSHALATDALVSTLDNPNIDDIYTQAKFTVGSASPPFVEEDQLSVSIQPSTINPGENVRITGTAKNNPIPGVAIWIIGKNYVTYDIVSVDGDSKFEYELNTTATENLANGQYSIVVQHPMYNDRLDINPWQHPFQPMFGMYAVGPYPVVDSKLFKFTGAGSLQGSDAAEALVVALDNPTIDDQYELGQFSVGEIVEPTIIPTTPVPTTPVPTTPVPTTPVPTTPVPTTPVPTTPVPTTPVPTTPVPTTPVPTTPVPTTPVPTFLKLPFTDPEVTIQQGWRYTDPIGPNPDDPFKHEGIDYVNNWQPFEVLAAADGLAMHSSGGGYGDFVLIYHNEIDNEGRNYFTLYSHLGSIEDNIVYRDRFATDYADWTPIKQGDKIGVVGATGASDPSWIHLHFEVQRGGYAQNRVDPYDIYNTRNFYPGGSDYSGCGSNILWQYDIIPPSSTAPKLITDKADDIDSSSAILKGHIENPEPGQIYNVCFRYEGGSSPKTKVGYTTVTSADPRYEYTLSGLQPGTMYYYRAIHEDSQGVGDTEKHPIDAENVEYFSTEDDSQTTLSNDEALESFLDTIDQLVENDPAYFNSDWDISKDQYKIIIATLAFAEGGKYGYSAHSSFVNEIGPDSYQHIDASNFYFSRGIGPFQIDLLKGTWSTIEKLNPNETTKLTLEEHKKLLGINVNTINDVRTLASNTWMAYGDEPYWAGQWQSLTGTNWYSVKGSNKANPLPFTWEDFKTKYKNNKNSIWYPYGDVVKPIGQLHWIINKEDDIKTDSGKVVILDESLDTFHIKAKGIGNEWDYYYCNNGEIEIWAYYSPNDNQYHLKSIFWREYREGAYPEKIITKPGEVQKAGKTLEHSVLTDNAKLSNVDVVLIIDSSGSMTSTDSKNLRKSAAKLFIDLVDDNDKIAVVDFDSSVRVWQPLIIAGPSYGINRVFLKNAVDKVDSNGDTNIGGGLLYGYNELNSEAANPLNYKAAVLLTDGQQNIGTSPSSVVPDYQAKGWPIYTIALSSDADSVLLKQIAADTGGQYYPAPDDESLQDIYNTISLNIKGSSQLDKQTGAINQGETLTGSLPVDTSVKAFNLVLTWPGSDLNLVLFYPNGNAVPINQSSPNGTDDPSISYISQNTYEIYKVLTPLPGNWHYEIIGIDVQGQEDYTLTLSAATGIRLNVSIDKQEYLIGEPVHITAIFFDEEKEISGAQVKCKVIRPDLIQDLLILTEEGNGTYRSSYGNTSQPGHYSILIEAQKEGINRQKQIGFEVNATLVPLPIVNFTSNTTLGQIPLPIQFVDTSTSDSITTRIWSFGDGETSTQKNPLHIYTTPGTYTVTLQVTNEAGTNTSTRTNYINVTQSLPLVQDFEGTPLVGNAPLEVVFTDTSSGGTTSRLWNFGDGMTVWKNETNTVSHTYSIPGTYTISLTLGNEEEQETITKTEYIQVNPTGTAPVARFIAVPMIGYEQKAIQFSDKSAGVPLKWQWDFGDGSSSSEQNPSHTYTTSGRFLVTLTVFNNGGSSSYSSTVWTRPTKLSFPTYNSTSLVIVKPTIPQSLGYSPISFFSMDKTFGSSPMTVQFTDMSFRSPSSWEWDFDDGETSTLQNPTHTYNMPGTYSVSLTVKNSIGESTTSRRVYVR